MIFKAPHNGQHITVEVLIDSTIFTPGITEWYGAFLDHFVLEPIADSLQGCTDALACNYLPNVLYDNNSCTYAPISIAASGGNLSAVGSLLSVVWSNGATTNTITPTANGSYWVTGMDSANCATDTAYYAFTEVGVNEQPKPKQLLRIVDVLGRESKPQPNIPLFYIYTDGTVEKKIVVSY